ADRLEVLFFALVDDLAVIAAAGVNPAQHLHQGGFAGAILAHDGVDFAFPHVQVDVRQRLDAWEGLGDAAHLQNSIAHASLSRAHQDRVLALLPGDGKGPRVAAEPHFFLQALAYWMSSALM